MNLMKLAGAAALILVGGLLSARAQTAGAVSGRVLDPSGAAVTGASIRLFSTGSGARASSRSDADGSYRLSGIAAGSYLIEAEASDAALTVSQRVEIRGEEIRLDLALVVSGETTQVYVTASSTPVSVFEIAKASDIVDGAEIERRVEFSIPEAVRLVPGVRVKQRGGPGTFTTIQIRGLRNQDTSVLVDGLRFRDAAGTQADGTGFMQDMQTIETDRVEVVRGPSSSLYGSNAIGGVMNIVSSQGGGKTHGSLEGEGGGLGLFRGSARVGGGLGADDRFVYSGGVTHLNVSGGANGTTPARNTSARGFARYSFTPAISLSGRGWGSDGFVALNDSPGVDDALLVNHPSAGAVPARGLADDELRKYARGESFNAGEATFIPAYNDPDSRRSASFFAGMLALRHELSPTASYRISYHGVDTNRNFGDGPAGRPSFDPGISTDDQFDGRIDTLQARFDSYVGAHNLVTAGYEFEREQQSLVNRDENLDPLTRINASTRAQQRSNSIFVQDQIRAADGRLQIGLSGRMQSFDLLTPSFTGGSNPYGGGQFESPKTAWTGDASLAYFFRESGTKIRGHVGNAYRSPSNFERFGGSFFFGSFSFWGDPGLQPERSIGIDGGIDQWLFDSKLRLSATYFYTRLQESITFDFGVIDPTSDPWGRAGGYRNSKGGLARGVEISATAAPTSSLNLTGTYTYVDSRQRTPTVAAENFFKTLGVSNHVFTLTGTQRLGNRFDVTFDLFWAGDYPLTFFSSPRLFRFPNTFKSDVVVSYTLPYADSKSIRFYAKVENFSNQRYYDDGFLAPKAWAVGGLQFGF